MGAHFVNLRIFNAVKLLFRNVFHTRPINITGRKTVPQYDATSPFLHRYSLGSCCQIIFFSPDYKKVQFFSLSMWSPADFTSVTGHDTTDPSFLEGSLSGHSDVRLA